MAIKDSKELGKAIKRGDDVIIVEGDLAKSTVRIYATGKVAWAVCLGAITVTVTVYLAGGAGGAAATGAAATGAGHLTFASAATGGLAAAGVAGVAAASGGAAATILGIPALTTAIAVAVAAGGVGALNTLRNGYKITEKSSNRVTLKRR